MAKLNFGDLDTDFKDSILNMDEQGIRKIIAEVTLNQLALKQAQKEDVDLAEKKASAKEAGLVYKEGTTANNLKLNFCRQALDGMGKDSGSFE